MRALKARHIFTHPGHAGRRPTGRFFLLWQSRISFSFHFYSRRSLPGFFNRLFKQSDLNNCASFSVGVQTLDFGKSSYSWTAGVTDVARLSKVESIGFKYAQLFMSLCLKPTAVLIST
jgi:hypothetical protein